MRNRLWRIVRAPGARRDPRLLDAAIDLPTPPLGLLSMATGAGFIAVSAATIARIAPVWGLIPWLVALAAIPAFVLIGRHAARAPRRGWIAGATAPRSHAGELATYISPRRGLDPSPPDSS